MEKPVLKNVILNTDCEYELLLISRNLYVIRVNHYLCVHVEYLKAKQCRNAEMKFQIV